MEKPVNLVEARDRALQTWEYVELFLVPVAMIAMMLL